MAIQSGAGKVYIMSQQGRAHVNHLFYSLFEIRPVMRMPVEPCQTAMSICGLSSQALKRRGAVCPGILKHMHCSRLKACVEPNLESISGR